MNNTVLSAFFLSLYLQGLSTYFYITGAIGLRTTVLTAVFQGMSLVLALTFSLGIPECRRKIQEFKVVELLFLTFFVAVILDITVIKRAPGMNELPPDVLPKFIVYMFALFIARCVTKAQFKLMYQITALISILTSIVLCRDFLAGTAVAVNNASRLAVGDSANPIEAGNLGAFAASVSLLISIKAKDFPTKILFLALMVPGTMVASLSGTRSAVLGLGVGAVFLLGTSILFKMKDLGKRLRQFSFASFFYYGLIALLLIGSLMVSSPNAAQANSSSTKTEGFALTRTFSRLATIPFLGGGSDASIQGRTSFYNYASREFSKNPVFGSKVYGVGFIHNAFLQTLGEFGIFGLVTYVLPVFWLAWRYCSIVWQALKQKANYFNTQDWTVTAFMGIVLIQAIFVLMVHAEPYRSYFPPCAIGLAIAFSRLGLEKKLSTK